MHDCVLSLDRRYELTAELASCFEVGEGLVDDAMPTVGQRETGEVRLFEPHFCAGLAHV